MVSDSLPHLAFIMAVLSQPMTTEPSQYHQELVERVDILRTNESFCDVTITVKGKEFKAHKVVLAAASPFFLALLTSGMQESNEKLIKIELEEATAPVMEDVLKYVYTGNVSVTEERAHNLIATADYLLIPSLKTITGNFLRDIVKIENCVSNYYFAEKYQCDELKEKSCEVINSNFSVVMETEEFLKLDVKQVMEWVSSDDVVISAEEEVIKGIVKWVEYNKSERESDFPELLHQVRLSSVSQDFVLNELVKDQLITRNAEFGLNFVVDAMKLILSASDGQVDQHPRRCLETSTDGIFVCGGRKALCYFPHQNTWYRLVDTLFDHEKHILASCKNKIYIVDKQVCKVGESQVMEFYIPTTNSWGAIQTDTVVTSFNGCAVLKGGIYATFFHPYGEAQIYRYDAETNCWDKVTAPPTMQWYPCVVADEQYLYIIGGISQETMFNIVPTTTTTTTTTTTRFDPSSNKWEKVADIKVGRCEAFGAAMNGKVFIAGGRQRQKVISSCEVYNPPTNEWQLMPSLNVPRLNASMVCSKGRLYVLGGATLNRKSMRVLSIEEFDSERNEWKEKSVIPVKSFETQEEEKKMNQFQACFARLCKGTINKLEPLN